MEGLCRAQFLSVDLIFGFPHLAAFAPQEGLLQDLSFSPSLSAEAVRTAGSGSLGQLCWSSA